MTEIAIIAFCLSKSSNTWSGMTEIFAHVIFYACSTLPDQIGPISPNSSKSFAISSVFLNELLESKVIREVCALAMLR